MLEGRNDVENVHGKHGQDKVVYRKVRTGQGNNSGNCVREALIMQWIEFERGCVLQQTTIRRVISVQ